MTVPDTRLDFFFTMVPEFFKHNDELESVDRIEEIQLILRKHANELTFILPAE